MNIVITPSPGGQYNYQTTTVTLNSVSFLDSKNDSLPSLACPSNQSAPQICYLPMQLSNENTYSFGISYQQSLPGPIQAITNLTVNAPTLSYTCQITFKVYPPNTQPNTVEIISSSSTNQCVMIEKMEGQVVIFAYVPNP